MDKDIIGIQCECSTNPDLNGYWTRKDLEEECEYLEQPKEDWLNHLFGHLFSDYAGWNSEIEDAFVNNDSLVSMRVMLGFYAVDITKQYK